MISNRSSWNPNWAAGAVSLALLVGAAGCTEKLDGSAGCPLTCSTAETQIQTVVIDAVSQDTTVVGGLGTGTEQRMLLASRGDTLDTRIIVRYDTLPGRAAASSTDTTTSTLSRADNATLTLTVDSGAAKVAVPVTVSVYDVDMTATDDTSAAALKGLFTPARLITSQVFAAGTFVDSAKINIPSSVIISKAQAGARLRLGLRLSASVSVSARIASVEAGRGPRLSFRTTTDTAVVPTALTPYSTTPTANRSIASSLGDFTIVVKGTPPPPRGSLAIGGLPGTRAYFRFNIPPRIVDSSLVVRATLILTQQPSPSPDPADTMSVQPYLVLAGTSVTDATKAAQIIAPVTTVGAELLKLLPGASGAREVEIAPLFRYWASQTETQLPRAIVLASVQEDYSPQQILFFSSSASDPTLRPKLRVSYTLRSRIGVP